MVYTIYRERGLGWWMIGALWGTAFAILRTPFTVAQATAAPFDDHQDQGGHGGHGGAGPDAAVMGLVPEAAGVKTLPPAYQADPAKPAASAYAATRGPDLNATCRTLTSASLGRPAVTMPRPPPPPPSQGTRPEAP